MQFLRVLSLLVFSVCAIVFTGCGGGATSKSSPPSGSSANFFVATNGNDGWSGTISAPNSGGTDGPFATLGAAQQAVRASLQNSGQATITVQIRAGEYTITQPLSFSSSDSGTASTSVVWENYPAETPILDGGTRITGWSNTTGNEWKVQLPASTSYFENLWYNGQRRLRPRLGPGNCNRNGCLGSYFHIVGAIYLTNLGPPAPAPDPNCTVYISGSGWQCYDRFYYDPNDPISSSWTNLTAPYPEGDIELYDFENWSVPELRIKSVDTANHVVYLTGPTQQTPPSPLGGQPHGMLPNHRYVIENVKDALTKPGQWFLDRSTSPWTLTYLANSGENPNNDIVIIPQSPQVLTATGLQFVTFKGITFEHDNYVTPAIGYPAPRQDTTIPGAVTCLNCQHVTFDSDVITQTSGGGIEFYTKGNATTSNNTIQNGAIYDAGAFGIRIGQPAASTDTDANVPQATTVQNMLITGYARVTPGAIGVVQGDGHDNSYTHNEISDGYHSGIEICALNCPPGARNSGGAFNNVTAFNHIHNIGEGVTSDMGCIYYNVDSAATGNAILNNKCHDVSDASLLDADGYGGQGIYLDNITSQTDVENNLVYRVSGVTATVTGGPATNGIPNIFKNNIFAYGRLGMLGVTNPTPYGSGSCPSSPALAFKASNNVFFFDRNASSPSSFYVQRGCSYLCGFTFPELQDWSSNIYWRNDGTFAGDPQAFHTQPTPGTLELCENDGTLWSFFGFPAWQGLGEDAQSAVSNPNFAGPGYPSDNFGLPASPGAGFVVFDPTQAGTTDPLITSPDVAPTFLTAPFKPSDF